MKGKRGQPRRPCAGFRLRSPARQAGGGSRSPTHRAAFGWGGCFRWAGLGRGLTSCETLRRRNRFTGRGWEAVLPGSPADRGGGIVASMSERFYVNCPLKAGVVVLEGPEAHHLTTVCRLRPGDQVCLFNGDGNEYPAEVIATARKRVELQVQGVQSPQRELGFRLEVAAPIPKGDRGQFLVEKLPERGVPAFIPLRTRRSVVHP